MTNLSKRLSAVAAAVTPGNRAADIGCDHGYVPIFLVSGGISPSAIAADVREGPLKRAEEHIREAGLESEIETRLSDGLAAIKPGEADTLILSGIGGMLLIRILRDGAACVRASKELVLSPQSDLESVRRFLKQSGCRIGYERVLEEEGKYYHIFHAVPEPDDEIWDDADYRFGKRIHPESTECALAFLENEERKARQISEHLLRAGGGREKAGLRQEQLKRELLLIRESRERLLAN